MTEPFELEGRRVLVAGAGISGAAAARALVRRGALVTVIDRADDARARERGAALEQEGVTVLLGAADLLPQDTELVVTSPGWRPDHPVLTGASLRGIPVWGEVELAWRLRPATDPAPWLAVTGTNGKTTTVGMLGAILRADGRRVAVAGNVGAPLVEAVTADEPPEVVVVELSSFQLHWTESVRAHSSVVLNVADDHTDWHGSFDAYAADKARIHQGALHAVVYNAADPLTERLVREADVTEGARAIGFTLGSPAPGQLGVVEDVLVDRAFVDDPRTEAVELGTLEDITPLAAHNVANALAAAALARSFGVAPAAVGAGLRGFRPDAHRIATVGVLDGVTYVDDSKATNPHAAAASLAAFDPVVWIAGGLAKGAVFDDLVTAAAPRLHAVVLIGRDRQEIADSLARHAPEIPVVQVVSEDTGAMEEAVGIAAGFARPGDTVLLAPACASMDLFRDYGHRGDAFADAVGRLTP